MNTTKVEQDIFGLVRMGYAVIESNKLKEWKVFLEQGLGLHFNDEEQLINEISFRMDNHAKRLIVQRGSAEDFIALGWQVKDQKTLDIIIRRLAEREIAYEKSHPDEAEQRGVKEFWRILGPKKQKIELFIEAKVTEEPLNMLTSSFVTGDAGMGHVAITSRKPLKMQRFWQEIFDARLSDNIEQVISGITLDITFLRLNERHHSVAIATTREVPLDPIRTKVQHMNVQGSSLDDLSNAFQRCKKLGYEMAHEIGQHPNDKELSFYVISPSGFEIEFGWAPLVVDENSWKPTKYFAISSWGHKPENPSKLYMLSTNLNNLTQGILTVIHPEYSPI
ncbi:extradiol ring-cleavage dioxygenase [Acinetobacter tandoii]|nr:extradiol ring-cleavage dioxygenase [Acinetobacter tandoii]